MCDSKSLTKTLSLKPTPPGNDFLTKDDLGREEFVYPLDLYFCENCFHIQLGHVVNPEILYQKNYTYVSSTSKQFVNHLKVYAQTMIKQFELKDNSFVVDIGSNDGTCLTFFKNNNMKVLGIDPAIDIARKASEDGIETLAEFFSYDLALQIKDEYGSAEFITSHNACAHIDNLFGIIEGVEALLDDDGIFVLEVGYFVDIFSNTWFDTIYHEHLDFHTVAPFEKLFERINMEIFEVQRISPQGGSIRVMAQKKNGKFPRDSSVDNLIKLEKDLGLSQSRTIKTFGQKINLVKEDLQSLLIDLKSKGKTIAGFGAPTKATTLMAHFDLDQDILDFIVDDNPLKQNLHTPMTNIPVLDPSELYFQKPDYVLILAWNFAEPIMGAHKKYSEEIGKFILPMPSPKIVA